MMPPPVVIRARRWQGAPLVSVRVWLRGGSRLERIPGQYQMVKGTGQNYLM